MKSIRHISATMICGPRFKVEFSGGDDAWAASVQLQFAWRGKHYWHCWFVDFTRKEGAR